MFSLKNAAIVCTVGLISNLITFGSARDHPEWRRVHPKKEQSLNFTRPDRTFSQISSNQSTDLQSWSIGGRVRGVSARHPLVDQSGQRANRRKDDDERTDNVTTSKDVNPDSVSKIKKWDHSGRWKLAAGTRPAVGGTWPQFVESKVSARRSRKQKKRKRRKKKNPTHHDARMPLMARSNPDDDAVGPVVEDLFKAPRDRTHSTADPQLKTEPTMFSVPFKTVMPISEEPVTIQPIAKTTVNFSSSVPQANQPPYARIKIYNLRLVIRILLLTSNSLDTSGCLHCPGNKVIVAKKGTKCAPLVLPAIKSCPSPTSINGRHVLWSLQGRGQHIGQILPEGIHTVVLQISTLKYNGGYTCTFKYQVQVMRCFYPPLLHHGVVECTNGRSWGSHCTFKCNPGFVLIGNPSTDCEGTSDNLNWTHPYPVCAEVGSCSTPEPPANGFVTCTPRSLLNSLQPPGTFCQYMCNPGYYISSNDFHRTTIHCRDRHWNNSHSHIPSCLPVTCSKPLEVVDGYTNCRLGDIDVAADEIDEFFVGISCRRQCNRGFVIPTSQLGGEEIECVGPKWNSGRTVECTRTVPPLPKTGSCVDQLSTQKFVPPAEFMVSDGRDANVSCLLDGRELEPGIYENECEAVDSELRTKTSCKYSVKIRGQGCQAPAEIPLATYNCQLNSIADLYPVGTACKYECSSPDFVIPTSQLEISTIVCGEELQWNATKSIHCKKQIAPDLVRGTCDDISIFLRNPLELQFSFPKFLTYSGQESVVKCNFSQPVDFGLTITRCDAVDLELRSSHSCTFSINIQKLGCQPLAPPTNGDLSCRMDSNFTYRCDIICHKGFSMSPQHPLLKKGFVECKAGVGRWDVEDFLPDCLEEMTTSMQTNLHFNASVVFDCADEENLIGIQTNIRDGLVERNRVVCDQIDCTDFTYLCSTLKQGLSIVETIWIVTAEFDTENYYDDPDESEAEVLLTKIQRETNRIVTSDETFHVELLGVGATVLKESYRQGAIDVVCVKIGFVVDPDTFRCLQCPTGTYYFQQECLNCPLNTFQDETGKTSCKSCPSGSGTLHTGTRMKAQCSDAVGNTLDDGIFHDEPCGPGLCRNGGTCLAMGQHDAICFCPEGYEGDLCERRSCAPNSCLNGGTCHFDRGTFACLCPERTTGLKCETINDDRELRYAAAMVRRFHSHPCASGPCMKGGLCIESPTSSYYHCQCGSDRTGDHCEHTICPVPYRRWFCLNGGQCVILDDTHAMVCLCKDGFIGSRCEYVEEGIGDFTSEETSKR